MHFLPPTFSSSILTCPSGIIYHTLQSWVPDSLLSPTTLYILDRHRYVSMGKEGCLLCFKPRNQSKQTLGISGHLVYPCWSDPFLPQLWHFLGSFFSLKWHCFLFCSYKSGPAVLCKGSFMWGYLFKLSISDNNIHINGIVYCWWPHDGACTLGPRAGSAAWVLDLSIRMVIPLLFIYCNE